MVGAKQFAIHRKISTARRINPLLAAISMPAFMKSNEIELHKPGAFVDKRRVTESSLAKLMQMRSSIKPVAKKVNEYKEEVEEGNELISDELANLITYKVLKNVKRFLNPEREREREIAAGPGRHIKLEISL